MGSPRHPQASRTLGPRAQQTGSPAQGPLPRANGRGPLALEAPALGWASWLTQTHHREALANGCGQAADGPARSAVCPAQSQQRVHSPGRGRVWAPGRMSGPSRLHAKAGTRPSPRRQGAARLGPFREGHVPCPAHPKTAAPVSICKVGLPWLSKTPGLRTGMGVGSRTGPWVGEQAENGQRPAGHHGAGTSQAPPPPVDAAAKPVPRPQEAGWSREGLPGTGAPATPSFPDRAEAPRWAQLPDPSPPPHRPPQPPAFSDWGQVPGPFLGPFSERP